ncbi:WD repeat-containing protein 81-like [Tigriopus californicus]|uniref:WD repeat-containing protein 81-like n=1 Tax=Tigriopus californicus TaxID=6832 RepID=UPI0027DAA2B1|nr:WD repeat-containing protein 81-like [Tigriopus californicus]
MDVLGVPEAYHLGDRALVRCTWIQEVVQSQCVPSDPFMIHDSLGQDEIQALLREKNAPPPDWMFITIQTFARRPACLVQPLPPLDIRAVQEAQSNEALCMAETLAYISNSNFVNSWKESHKQFGSHGRGANRGDRLNFGQEHDLVLLEILRRIYPDCPLVLGPEEEEAEGSLPRLKQMSNERSENESLEGPVHTTKALALLLAEDSIYVILPLNLYSVHEAITYSTAFFQDPLFHPLFIIYQVLKAMRDLHARGLSIGNIGWRQVFLTEDSFVKLDPDVGGNIVPILNVPQDKASSESQDLDGQNHLCSFLKSIKSALHAKGAKCETQVSDESRCKALEQITALWTRGDLSNFDYVMVLNYLSGRSFENPYHYPVLPWVKDFSSEIGGWRDLSKSKFRLNKGDTQLDLTYDSLMEMQKESSGLRASDPKSVQPPHHVTEVLSEITYYVYQARRTSQSVLCKHVRNRWVPAEYPSSMERLQEWTPDECIPDFFTDPKIFKSIHNDLPDLAVPEWCSSPEDFIQWHRSCLESPQVSEKLHHWLDLTFGYKLTGSSAIRAKNVCLDLVEGHRELRGQGVVQLFTNPHPSKATSNPFWNRKAPRIDVFLNSKTPEDVPDFRISSSKSSMQEYVENSETIFLPQEFDPLLRLKEVEALMSFSSIEDGPQGTNKNTTQANGGAAKELAMRKIVQDMQVLGCLILELYVPEKFIHLGSRASLKSRFQTSLQILTHERSLLPYLILPCVDKLILPGFRIDPSDRFPAICDGGLPPPSAFQFLNPLISPLAFPTNFTILAKVLRFVHNLDFWNNLEHREENPVRDLAVGEYKVKTIVSELGVFLDTAKFEDICIIFPLFKSLFLSPSSSVQCAWYLFDPLAKVLGPTLSKTHLLALILKIYDGNASTSKHLKLYHRTFLQFLIVRFGTKLFLNYFSTYLIEAVGGYKDYEDEPAHLLRQGLDRDWEKDAEIEPQNVEQSRNTHCSSTSDQVSLDESLAEGEVFSFDRLDTEQTSDDLDPMMQDAKVHASKGLIYIPAVTQNEPRDSLRVWKQEKRHPSGNAGGNISQVAAESVLWLCHRLGPVLTAKFLSRNLLRMLNLCYMSLDSYAPVSEEYIDHPIRIGTQKVHGDLLAQNVLECLSQVACLYGDQMILLQYLPYTWDLISISKKKFTPNLEGGLVGSIALLHHIVPYLSDSLLMNELQDNLLGNILFPVLQLSTSKNRSFLLGSQSRAILVYKFLDVVYLIGLRIGEEMAKTHLTPLCTAFFSTFDHVWTSEGHLVPDFPNLNELSETLSMKIAYSAYVAFYNLMGRSHLDESITNLGTIKALCLVHQDSGEPLPRPATHRCLRGMNYESSPSSGNKVEISASQGGGGNFVLPQEESFNTELHGLITKEIPNANRHLKGNWLAYWEHEIGKADVDAKFSLKQIKLQNFHGHQGAIKSLFVMDNENSFLSGSRDRTVKVWSLRSQGDGNSNMSCQWTYPHHKKSVYSVFFKERLRHVVSHDSTVHVWDPFVGMSVFQMESGQLVHNLADFPAPSPMIITVSQDSMLHLVDCRLGQNVTDLKGSTGTSGLVRTLQVVPNGLEVLLGHGSGFVTILDIRTGRLRQSWKAHEGEILSLTPLSNAEFLTTSLDQTMCLWNSNEAKLKRSLPGAQEPIHCVGIMGQNVITGSTANRIGVRYGLDAEAPYQSNKLRTEIIKTNLTSMRVLAHNRLLLLGQESGSVSLIC